MKVTTFEADRQMCTQSSDPAQQQTTHGRMKINMFKVLCNIQLCFAIHGLHLKCGGCYVKVSVCKFHRADIHTRLACALVMLHGGAYKQDSGSWELSRVMLHRRCIQTRQWFMGTEQSKA